MFLTETSLFSEELFLPGEDHVQKLRFPLSRSLRPVPNIFTDIHRADTPFLGKHEDKSSNKVRRGFIAEKYQVLVDALYGGKSEQYVQTQVKFEDGRTGVVSATLKIVDTKLFEPVKAAA